MMSGFEWGMGLGGLVWLVAAVALIAAVVWSIVSLSPRRDRQTDEAAQILKARFARGEITEAEYEQARRLLEI